MSRSNPAALAVVVCVILVGCSAPAQQAPPTASVDPAPTRPAPINGSYNGMMQLVTGSPDSCGTQDIFRLQIQNRAFRYVLAQPQVPWRPSIAFDVVIAPDGSFHAASGPAYVDGKVAQGHMQGQVVGDACSFQFEADNTGSF